MASISHDRKTGRRTVQFVGPDGRRRSVRLGPASKRQAEVVRAKVEDLVAALLTGHTPSDETSRWVATLPDVLRKRLAAVGLIAPRESLTLKAFIDRYLDGRADIKPSTRTVLGHTRRNLLAFFGPDKPLRDITQGDAEEWRQYLVREGLADNTVRRRTGIARQFLGAAKRRRLVSENPFAGLAAAVRANPRREFFVTREMAAKVLDACPDAEWRLIFALARYGGLRCPSEHLALRWEDIDWAGGRFTVHSPKTEHHPGGESRLVPLFPELEPYLREVFEQAEPGTVHVIARYRRATQNLRTHLCRIIRNAGLEPWPKLFQNLRATRETELADRFPMHVVCAWIGNSRAVALRHYLQVTDDHFRQAVQNPVQSVSATTCQDLPAAPSHQREPAIVASGQQVAGAGSNMSRELVGVTGLEPVTSSL